MGCSPLPFWPLGSLQRETEARKDFSIFQATSQGQSLILQAPSSGDALHQEPSPWGAEQDPLPAAMGALSSAWHSKVRGQAS